VYVVLHPTPERYPFKNAESRSHWKRGRQSPILSSVGSLRWSVCWTGQVDVLFWKPCVSAREMAGKNYCAEGGEAEKDEAEDSVDETEEVRADPVRDEANNDS
jgi:hypothetical protein